MPASPSCRTTALDARSLVNAGVFAALYFVILFATALIGFINPALHLLGILVGTLMNAAVTLLYMAKTPRMWAMTAFGTVIGATMVLLGQFWGTVLLSALCGLAADLIVRAGAYRRRLHVCIAYGVFQFWTIAPLFPVILGSDAFFQRIALRQGVEYADLMRNLFTPWFLLSFQVVVCLVGCVAAWLATRILAKHFTRAGIL